MAQLPTISAQYAQQKLVQLRKHIPSSLNYLQNFYKHEDIKYLSLPKPTYAFQQPIAKGRNCSIQKQLEYLRGKQSYDWHYQSISDILEDERQNSTGLLNKKRNCSIFVDNTLYYAVNNHLMMISIEFNIQSELIKTKKPETVTQLKWQILQLFQRKKNKQQIYIRTRNSIIQINLNSKQSQILYDSDVQISGSMPNFWNNQIDVCQQHRVKYKIKCISQKGSHQIYQTKQNICSFWRYTPSEMLILKSFQMGVVDNRQKKYSVLIKNTDIQERLYSSIPLRNENQILPYFAVCDSSYINIFDIRKPTQIILRYRHCNEEAPPVILQYFSQPTNYLSNIVNENCLGKDNFKLLVAHSPYSYGSSTYKMLNLQQQINSFRQKSLQCIQYETQFMNLLYDTGKIFKNAHPSSITATFFRQKLLFFHVDNLGGISLQCFSKNQSGQFQHEIIAQKAEQQRSSTVNYLFPGQSKIKDKQLDPRFRKFIFDEAHKYTINKKPMLSQIDDQSIQLQQIEEEHPSISYYNLNSFAKRLHDMSAKKDKNKQQLSMTMSQERQGYCEDPQKFQVYQITIEQMKNLIRKGQMRQTTAFQTQNILNAWNQQEEEPQP